MIYLNGKFSALATHSIKTPGTLTGKDGFNAQFALFEIRFRTQLFNIFICHICSLRQLLLDSHMELSEECQLHI